MNEKDILDKLLYCSENDDFIIEIRKDRAKILLDYITNLQKENRILKELNVCVGCELPKYSMDDQVDY